MLIWMVALGGGVDHGVIHRDEGPIQDLRDVPGGIPVHTHETDPGSTLEKGLGSDPWTETSLGRDLETDLGRDLGRNLETDLGTTPGIDLKTDRGTSPARHLQRGPRTRTTRMATNLRTLADILETPRVHDTMMKLNLLLQYISVSKS